MPGQALRLPSRKWSILALSSTILVTVVISYLLAVAAALAFLVSPYLLLVVDPLTNGTVVVWRLLLSAFGVVVGFTVLRSLWPEKNRPELNAARIYLTNEPALAREIEAIAGALNEPMPSEVYLLGDVNAFVAEVDGRRIMGIGLPLLQMLSLGELRAVLAHEFAHYYAGDTRLGPYVHSAKSAMERVYQNLGRNSTALRYLTRYGVVKVVYLALMKGMQLYWRLFMRIAHAVSRQQEFRSDELACHVAGSQALISGLESIRKCQAGLNSYWGSFVAPVVNYGYRPEIAHEFQRYMQAPHIASAAAEFAKRQAAEMKASPFDTHPPLGRRIERAKAHNISAPALESADNTPDQPAISLIQQLGALEADLLKKLLPKSASAELKPFNWDTAAADIYIPAWRKQVEPFLSFLGTQTLGNFPMLALDPKPLIRLIPDAPGAKPNMHQRTARAYEILFYALAICLLDNGWSLGVYPAELALEKGEAKVHPSSVLNAIRAGKLSIVDWNNFRSERGIGDWPLAVVQGMPVFA